MARREDGITHLGTRVSSVQLLSVSDSLWPHESQHTRAPCPSPTPGAYSNTCPLSRWCHPTISSLDTLFSCPQSFPASGSFPMNWLFTSGGQSVGASTSASVLPMNIQGWFPLGLTCLISLQSKGLSRVSSNITVWKHQFFSTQPSLCSIHSLTSIHDYWKNHSFDKRLFAGKVVSQLFNTLSRFIIALWYLPASCGSSWTTKKMKGKWLHY